MLNRSQCNLTELIQINNWSTIPPSTYFFLPFQPFYYNTSQQEHPHTHTQCSSFSLTTYSTTEILTNPDAAQS